jgi:hypothetical protein
MGVSAQHHPSRALPPGKGPPVPTGQEARWASEPVWTQRLEEKFTASVGDRTLVVQSVVRVLYILYVALQHRLLQIALRRLYSSVVYHTTAFSDTVHVYSCRNYCISHVLTASIIRAITYRPYEGGSEFI